MALIIIERKKLTDSSIKSRVAFNFVQKYVRSKFPILDPSPSLMFVPIYFKCNLPSSTCVCFSVLPRPLSKNQKKFRDVYEFLNKKIGE